MCAVKADQGNPWLVLCLCVLDKTGNYRRMFRSDNGGPTSDFDTDIGRKKKAKKERTISR